MFLDENVIVGASVSNMVQVDILAGIGSEGRLEAEEGYLHDVHAKESRMSSSFR